MLKPEQREAIYRLALQQQYADLSDYLDSITVPDKPLIYGCHCDLEPEMKPDGCVLDYGKPEDCVYAKILVKNGQPKEDCGYWKPIGDSNV